MLTKTAEIGGADFAEGFRQCVKPAIPFIQSQVIGIDLGSASRFQFD